MAKYKNWSLKVGELKGKWDRGEIIPDPEWQRLYIWSPKDEELLIDSLLKGIPIPKFYLTQEWNSKKKVNIHSIIDGQQRLTAAFKFLSNEFMVKINNRRYYFKDLDSTQREQITSRKLTGHILTNWTLPDVTFLFERINRTGVKLTNMEAWNSRYASSSILKLIKGIVKQHRRYYHDIVYTPEDIRRLVHLDDVLDIVNSISSGWVTAGNKKNLEKFLEANKDISELDANHIKTKFRKAIVNLKKIFPKDELQATQFAKRTNFISLLMAISFTSNKYYLLSDTDALRTELINFIIDPSERYRETLSGGIRHKERREKRVKILSRFLRKYGKALDPNRHFSTSIKMKLWNSPNGHECKICHEEIVGFKYATGDHIVPWAKGGKTKEANAQIAHKSCNSKKRDQYEKYIIIS